MNARLDPIIEQFRFSHHNLAMMFAMGMTIGEISQRTGFTRRRLIILLDDPTFQQLIAHYQNIHRDKMLEALPEAIEEMAFLRSASVRKLAELFEESDDTGEPIPPSILLKVFGEMSDRTGYSKHVTKNINIDVNFATALDRAIERSGKGPELKLIEGGVLPAVQDYTQPRVVESVPRPRAFRRA